MIDPNFVFSVLPTGSKPAQNLVYFPQKLLTALLMYNDFECTTTYKLKTYCPNIYTVTKGQSKPKKGLKLGRFPPTGTIPRPIQIIRKIHPTNLMNHRREKNQR